MVSSPRSPEPARGSPLGRIIAFLITTVLAGAVVAGLAFPSAAAVGLAANGSVSWMRDLPKDLSHGPISRESTLYARDGKTELATFFAENRQPVTLDEISPHMQDAIISIEDRGFYDHGGISLQGIFRAIGNNFLSSGGRQGASTLTQQYVNNLIIDRDVRAGREPSTLGPNKGYTDKIQEMKLAISMEQELPKDEILAGYLNMVLFGPGNYGIEAAAQYYWGIPAKDLNIPQSALLAGMVQSPEYYNPQTNPEAAKDRRNTVLFTMKREGKISQEEYDKAVAAPIELDIHPRGSGCYAAESAPYFCDYVQNQVLASDAFGSNPDERMNTLQRGGLKMVSTLDVKAQKEADKQVNKTQPKDDNPDNVSTSMVTVEPKNGDIVSMAQNSNYSAAEGKSNTVYNFNTDLKDGGTGGYQVGSTFKPYTLLAWVQDGRSVGQEIDASRLEYPADHKWEASCAPKGYILEPGSNGEGFKFQNAEKGFDRKMKVEFGIYNSINSATYAMADQLDLCDIGAAAKATGVHNGQNGKAVDTTKLSAILGGSADNISPLTMATSYATFANDGVLCRPRALTSVTGHDGTEYDVPAPDCHRAIEAESARAVNHVLKQVLTRGSGWERNLELPDGAGAKTGTTDNSTQTWMVGYTKGLSTASWVGNYELGGRSLNDVSIGGDKPASETADPDDWVDGSGHAGEQWQGFMDALKNDYDHSDFPKAPEKLTKGSKEK